MNAAVDRFSRLESSRLSRIAAEAAKAALERCLPRLATPRAPARSFNFKRPAPTAPAAAAPEDAPAPARRTRAPKTCTACGATGHRRNSPEHHPKEGAAAAAPAPPADPSRSCTTCTPPAEAAPPAPPEPVPPAAEPPAPADPSEADAFTPEAVVRARAHSAETTAGRVRAKTISPHKLTRVEKRAAELVVYPDDVERPRTRGDCQNMPRPCPWVSCAHHLYLDVNEETGAIKLNFPHLEVWEMKDTCSLDVADRGGTTLEDVGTIVNLTRERIRQLEMRAVSRLKRAAPDLADAAAPSPELAGVEDRLGWR